MEELLPLFALQDGPGLRNWWSGAGPLPFSWGWSRSEPCAAGMSWMPLVVEAAADSSEPLGSAGWPESGWSTNWTEMALCKFGKKKKRGSVLQMLLNKTD